MTNHPLPLREEQEAAPTLTDERIEQLGNVTGVIYPGRVSLSQVRRFARLIESEVATTPKQEAVTAAVVASPKLWLWKNFVDGRPEYWAFDNPYPINLDNGDPQTLGEPCGYAILKPSRQGRKDKSEEQVIDAIKRALAHEEVSMDLNLVWNTLMFFAKESSYTTGERTGGVLQGCPREPPPTPAQMAVYGRRALAALRRHVGKEPEAWMMEDASTIPRVADHLEDGGKAAEVPAPFTRLKISGTHEWRLDKAPCGGWALFYLSSTEPNVELRYASRFEAELLNAAKHEIDQLRTAIGMRREGE